MARHRKAIPGRVGVDAGWICRQLLERGASLLELAAWAADYCGADLADARVRVGDLLRELEHGGAVLFSRGRWSLTGKGVSRAREAC